MTIGRRHWWRYWVGIVVLVSLAYGFYVWRTLPTLIRLAQIQTNDTRSIPYARQCLRAKEPDIRTSAALALGTIGPRADQAVPDLIRSLGDDAPAVAANAAWALGTIRKVNAETMNAILQGLDHPDSEVRRYSAYALSLWGPQAGSAVPALTAKLDDPKIAYMAAQALGEIGKPARPSIPQLALLLKSESSSDRAAALTAVSKLQPLPPEVIAAMDDLLADTDAIVRDTATEIINKTK